MKVMEISTTSDLLVIEDKNTSPITWDTSYSIQKLSEAGVWYDLKQGKYRIVKDNNFAISY